MPYSRSNTACIADDVCFLIVMFMYICIQGRTVCNYERLNSRVINV